MSLHHTVLAQCDHKRDLRFEFIDLCFHLKRDCQHLLDASFSEEADDTNQELDTVLNELLRVDCVELFPLYFHPQLFVLHPVVGCDP